MDVIEHFQKTLQPQGTMPVVRLFLQEGGRNFFDKNFVDSCVNCLEKKLVSLQAGLEELNPLERLALHVLSDSSYLKDEIDYQKKKNKK